MLLRRKKNRPYGHRFRRAYYDAVDAFERVGDFGRRADYCGVGVDLMQIKAAHSLKLLIGFGEGYIGPAQIVQVRGCTIGGSVLGDQYFRFCERSFV
jgi:hypothetical protein